MTLLPRRSAIGNDDLGRRRTLLVGLGHKVLVALDTGLRLGLAGLGRSRHPLALALDGALVRLVLAALLLQALLLLLEPGRVIALVGNAAAAVELEDPARHVVEEVAVVGDDQDRARIVAQVAFEPGGRLGVEMVGRLVEEQKLGLLQEQLAQGDAAALAARELVHGPVVRRAAQGVHGLIDLGIEIPQALGLDLVLEPGHLVRRLVGIVHGEVVVAVEDRLLGGHALHDVLADVLRRVELRLLRQVADPRALGDPALAVPVRVGAGHDAQKRRLTGAVDAEHADLGIRIEGQVDIIQDLLAARIGLGEATHVVDELTGHGKSPA